MQFFEKDGEVYKHVPAGGTGGGVTSYATVKATDAEAAAFRASQADAPAEAAADPVASLEPAVETEDPSKLTADPAK
jgi:hypothetical protein